MGATGSRQNPTEANRRKRAEADSRRSDPDKRANFGLDQPVETPLAGSPESYILGKRKSC